MIEKQNVEFKREYNDKVNKTMLAFLNTDGGTLYLGMSDDSTIYGLEGDIDEWYRKTINSFRDSVTPDPTAFFHVEPEQRNDKWILTITVERGAAIPYCFSKHGLVPEGVYIRIGSNTVMATREHIRQMIKDNGMGQFISELSIEQNLTFEYADTIFAEKNIEFKQPQKLTMGLIRADGRYSNLALILSDQCPYTTKAAIFEGKNKETFKDRKEFAGSVFKQIDDVLAYLNVFNRVHGTFEGAYRIDHSDYPEVALREAYVNSLIHRDYYIEGSIIISMFDDRLEFMSVGGMMPDIPVVDGGFLVRLPNRNYNSSQVNTASFDREQLIIEAFTVDEFTKEDAAKILNISVSGAYKVLKRMNDDGLLKTRKKGKQLMYSVRKIINDGGTLTLQ